MKIVVVEGKPTIQEMPDGDEVLFFAKIDEHLGYCVIFGSRKKCLPKRGDGMAELFNAKVAFGGLGADMEVVPVKHGHKYEAGGGFVETEKKGQIFFRLTEEDEGSTYEGGKIREVYAVM